MDVGARQHNSRCVERVMVLCNMSLYTNRAGATEVGDSSVGNLLTDEKRDGR